MIDKKLCDKVKSIRLNCTVNPITGKPISQAEFANYIGVSQSVIAKIEAYRTEPSKKLLNLLKEKYGSNFWLENEDSFSEYSLETLLGEKIKEEDILIKYHKQKEQLTITLEKIMEDITVHKHRLQLIESALSRNNKS
jgi:transcriptional regulator with XRE-family HTH domain